MATRAPGNRRRRDSTDGFVRAALTADLPPPRARPRFPPDLCRDRNGAVPWGGRVGQPFRSSGEPLALPAAASSQTPQLGRVFTDADAVDDAHRIVLLSHSTGTNRFRSDPNIVGAPVELNDEPHIIVGVLSDGFEEFPTERTELWTPLVVEPDPEPVAGRIVSEGACRGIGRLRPRGVRPSRSRPRCARSSTVPQMTARRPPGFELETRVTSLRKERGRSSFRDGAPDAGRGHRPGVADGVRQRGLPAARARDRAHRRELGARLRDRRSGPVLSSAPPRRASRRAPTWSGTLNDASAPTAGGFGRRRAVASGLGQAMLATGQVALVLVLLTAAGLL